MDDKTFLQQYDSSKFEKMSVAVDLLVFTVADDTLKLVTIKRAEPPFEGFLSFPGVFVNIGETLEEAVRRGIKEETGLEGIYFEQLYTWGDLDRDPRMRILSVSYLALVPVEKLKFIAGERVSETKLYSVDYLLSKKVEMAFDHKKILKYARERLKNKVEYTKIAFELVPEEFTLPYLQRIYEILLDKKLYKTNFRKKIEPMVVETDKMETSTKHRPSKFYKRAKNIG